MKTGILRAAIPPALATWAWLYFGWSLEYTGWMIILSVISAGGYQWMDGLFLYGIHSVDSREAQSLWAKIDKDEELWSLKTHIWVVMLLGLLTLVNSDWRLLTLFFSFTIMWCLIRYMKHVVQYDEAVNRINAEITENNDDD